MHPLPRQGGSPPARPQRRLLPRVLHWLLPPAGRARDRRPAHVHPGRSGPGCSLGREGQPGAVGRPRRARLSHDGPVPRAGHRRVLEPVTGEGRGVRRRSAAPATRGRAGGGGARARRARRRIGHTAFSVLGVRNAEAPLLRRGGARGRVRRPRDRSQPRRRSGAVARQRPALAGGPPGPPAPRPAAHPPPVRPQGEAVAPPGRVRDGGLCVHARHRLRRRRMPEQRRRDPARLQGRPEPPRSSQPGHQARLRPGIPAHRTAGVRGARGGRATPPTDLRALRDAVVGRGLRVLQAGRGGGDQAGAPPRRTRSVSTPDPVTGPSPRSVLRDREPVVLLDRKGRSYLRTLRRGGRLSVRGAPIPCDEVIGRPEGTTVVTAGGERLLVFRPTYAQLIPSLPRQAQPIYPKDVGPLLLWGDICPGQLVVEVGTGPGALTLALLRAVGPTGQLVSYEVREDFALMARDNIARFHGVPANWTLRVADAFAGIVERDVDR